MKWSLEHFVSSVNFGALIQQVFNELRVAAIHSIVEARLLVHSVNFAKNLILLALPLAQILHDSTSVTTLT